MRRHLLAAGLGALALAMAPALALGQQQSNDAGALAGGSNGAIVAQQTTGGPVGPGRPRQRQPAGAGGLARR